MSPRRYIAVIDDDESHCRSLARLLQQTGFQVITFLSAEEFLEDRWRRQFDCLIVDIQLGGMSGIELHAKLAEQGDTTPVVYLTAFDDPLVRAQAYNLGCSGYFRKTDAGLDIVATVRRVTSTAAAN